MIQPERVRTRQKDWAPKPLNNGSTRYDVAIRKTPKIGSVYFQNKDGQTIFYKLIHTGFYKALGKTDKSTILYWERQDGKLFASGVFHKNIKELKDHDVIGEDDAEMHQSVAEDIGLAEKRSIPKTFNVGETHTVKILHKNTRSMAVVENNVPMTIVFKHPRQDADYWHDREGNPYWGRKGSREVRPFPVWIDLQQWIKTTGNQINCSG